ncbi:hypothetical protein MMC12_008000 [Toensbergia leucococca]|nr:hypothetical protein [Toensbergia leucococca]
MPPWGRPLGARQRKKRKGWEPRTRHRTEDRQFEELDSEDDDRLGVGLGKSFASDELYFTGADIGPRLHGEGNYDYKYKSESSDDSEDQDSGNEGTMQLALRDKEELLVRKAMERIRRAQMLGRTKVTLTQPEIDALERKRQHDQIKRRIVGPNAETTNRRRSSTQPAGIPKSVSRKPSKQMAWEPISTYGNNDSVPSPTSYGPLGYYSPAAASSPYGPSPRSRSRSGSSHSLRNTPPFQSNQHRGSQKWYSSFPEPSQLSSALHSPSLARPLPDDINWIPRPRSASSNNSHAAAPQKHQSHSPPLPQTPQYYSQGRRISSGPPDLKYPKARRAFPPAQPNAASSVRSFPRRAHPRDVSSERSDGGDDSEDDGNYGVQINVVPDSQSYGANMDPEDGSKGRQRRDLR